MRIKSSSLACEAGGGRSDMNAPPLVDHVLAWKVGQSLKRVQVGRVLLIPAQASHASHRICGIY